MSWYKWYFIWLCSSVKPNTAGNHKSHCLVRMTPLMCSIWFNVNDRWGKRGAEAWKVSMERRRQNEREKGTWEWAERMKKKKEHLLPGLQYIESHRVTPCLKRQRADFDLYTLLTYSIIQCLKGHPSSIQIYKIMSHSGCRVHQYIILCYISLKCMWEPV